MSTRRSSAARSTRRFAHVRLQNWHNFSRVDLPLQERNFLVGPNASGKSNFLDVFRFLGDLVAVSGGLGHAVARRAGVSEIRCLAAKANPSITVEVEIGGDAEEPWRYRLVFGQDPVRHLLQVKEEVVHRGDREVLRRPDEDDLRDPERLRQTHLEQVTANREFRPIAEFFRSIRYYHIVPQLVRESERWESPEVDPYGGDFIERVLEVPLRTRMARLRRIQKALTVAVPQLSELVAERDSRGIAHLRGRYQHWRPHGKWQTESQFSDGTLRLLGLLWSLLDEAGPLLLEEPELSLHPAVVRHIPQLMARLQEANPRQLLVSTHSADLLQDEDIAPEEVLLFTPSERGTEVQSGASIERVRQLLEAGVPMPEVVLAETQPENAIQLPSFAG
ncbi:MAG TPA: AAA family ATPase [Candidatus Dormibacteraeota bacterium]|nr:AAA family ATPase [Candidatus Dormibacteraeota bacterium]